MVRIRHAPDNPATLQPDGNRHAYVEAKQLGMADVHVEKAAADSPVSNLLPAS